ncbi:Na+/alanine symporter [Sphingobacterium multivorum]|uniref:Na+/alanine symporter n=1 Tax=Sphingobacterium multivorum TaxID=28454 RepID=A0A2X2KUB0_SPHMU|nr:alanine:cation symporter family protein [Sphingobacterium multivorum]SPZ85669.1 Na+/alanine symporter [Sphingobacterium multivorum]
MEAVPTKASLRFRPFRLLFRGALAQANIAGVATAIAMGGPGAIFWMWVIAFLGSASAIVEATLGQMYKEVNDGNTGADLHSISKRIAIQDFCLDLCDCDDHQYGFLLPGCRATV